MTTMTALTYYKSLTDSKVSADEAFAQAAAFDAAIIELATKEDLKTAINGLENRINDKLYTIRTLGWALFGLLCIMATAIVRIALIVGR